MTYGRDSFAKLLVANLQLADGRRHARKNGTSAIVRFAKDAGKFFHSALTHEPQNVYAGTPTYSSCPLLRTMVM
jgi:hypothetical protein